jgi:DNA helicase II / ATP-dependent DNA helicase PcrA
MILWVIDLFQTYPDILLNYQERFQYIMIDEFQDTNGSQNEIEMLLTQFHDVDANIFVVGDEDQSIYRFQGANISNIFSFYSKFISHRSKEEQEERVIILSNNYRSTPAILAASTKLIDQNNERLTKANMAIKITKDLIASNKKILSLENEVIVREFPNTYQEIIHIADEIKDLIQHKNVSPNEIAVLYRSHFQSEELIRYLTNCNIQIRTQRRVDTLSQVLTNQVLEILRYVAGEKRIPFSKEDAFFNILFYPFNEIKQIDVAMFQYKYLDVMKKANQRFSLRQYIETLTLGDSQLDKTIIRLKELLENQSSWTLQSTFEKILTDFGIIKWVADQPNKIELFEELNTIFEFIKEETKKSPLMHITEFVALLDLMQAEGITIPLYKLSSGKSAVNFATIHGSKGLEYEYVFVIGNTDKAWSYSGSAKGYYIPTSISEKVEDENSEEERRLLFVAMTRAKKQLYLSYSEEETDGTGKIKANNPSQFINELNAHEYKAQKCTVEAEQLAHFTEVMLTTLSKENLAKIDDVYLDEMLEDYRLSVTHLNKYLLCPKSFYFDQLLQIPKAKSASLAFGNAVHKTLELYFKSMKENEDVFPDDQFLIDRFEFVLNLSRECYTEKEYLIDLAKGKKCIVLYAENYKDFWNKNVELEKKMQAIYDGVPIKGAMDKIELTGTQATIVDYKTGKADNVSKYKSLIRPLSPEELTALGEEAEHAEIYGGDYWRQAVFYKILVEYEGVQNWTVHRTVFDFVEPDKNTLKFAQKDVVIMPSDEDIVKSQIKEVYSNIKAKRFEGCGQKDCEWCERLNLVK